MEQMVITSLTIEKPTHTDLLAVQGLLKSFKLPVKGIEEHFKSFLVLKSNNQVIGCAGMEIYESTALLRSVAIHPQEHGKGYGKRLITHILGFAKEKGVKNVFLLTESAEGYFQRLGFMTIARKDLDERIKETEEFLVLCPDSAASMRLSLNSSHYKLP